jgi:hypothetical protein
LTTDKVGRNVAALTHAPKGKAPGRPSRSLTLAQAVAVLKAAEKSLLYAYIVLSLLAAYAPRKRGPGAGTTWSWTGSGTEECRRGPWQGSVLS